MEPFIKILKNKSQSALEFFYFEMEKKNCPLIFHNIQDSVSNKQYLPLCVLWINYLSSYN